jgi:hypothetical protein
MTFQVRRHKRVVRHLGECIPLPLLHHCSSQVYSFQTVKRLDYSVLNLTLPRPFLNPFGTVISGFFNIGLTPPKLLGINGLDNS